ncbi:L-rhamnose/proton symporter RhaT [Flavisolibacter nicotianae]|uniref:L-rhamnose/proton symporter RhaT n=1 Tax=Flavisolibacter nicotianae TaxID=2364882 RepID=UPI001F08E84F|nr:L-rhamnose/proton symporter RhaT [Flavisolibacter nicotianae]
MQAILGVIFHFIGGFASGSFYMPYKKVKGWSWESYWIVGGIFSWLIVPPLAAFLTIPNFWEIIAQTDSSTLFYTYLFGLLWGIGGLTYGLGVRYLGVSLGSSIILGLCMVFGSLVPSFYYQFSPQEGKDTIGAIAGSTWGLTVLTGLLVCVVGIIICGRAGTLKEKELKEGLSGSNPSGGNGVAVKQRRKVLVAEAVAADNGSHTPVFEEVAITPEAPPSAHGAPASNAIEYKFGLGLTLAIISGLLSACFNFGLEAGKPMSVVANTLWKSANPASTTEFLFRNNVTYVVVLWGGLTTNLVWCVILNARNRSFGDYANKKTPLLKNYIFSALAGTTWFLQFFFYGMGESKLGNGASSWILHMSFIILIANMWGLVSNEWKGVSKKTRMLLFAGVAVIIAAVLVVGYGNYLKQ